MEISIKGKQLQYSSMYYFRYRMNSGYEGLDVSGVSKKKSPSTGYDFYHEEDDFSDMDECFDVKDDEIDIEEDYLHKLKAQRQRMERLSKLYQEKQQQLEREVKKNYDLLSEVDRLNNFVPYKEQYESLQHNYDELLMKAQITNNQLSEVKQELAKVIYDNNQTIIKLKTDLKNSKQASKSNTYQLEEAICDKQEQIKKMKREWKDKEDLMEEEIKTFKNTVLKLQSQVEQETIVNQNEKNSLVHELKIRESTILDLEKNLQQAKRINMELKASIVQYSEELTNRENQLTTICNKIKQQLQQTKKSLSEKECLIEEQQNDMKKLRGDNIELTDELDDLKTEFKRMCEMYETNNTKLKYDSDNEILKLESFIKELKDSIEELMEVKNHLIGENRKLISILKKKQQHQKQRKQILRTQLKEINLIEKVIDKIH